LFGEDRFRQGLSACHLAHPGFLRGDPPHTGSFPFIADSVEGHGYPQSPASAGTPETKRFGPEVIMGHVIFKQTFTQ
jgi:hypothetical protein